MCGSMADIQSPTDDIRRGKEKKKERKKERRRTNDRMKIYNGLPYYIGRPKTSSKRESSEMASERR